MNAAKRRMIFERLAQANPSPTTELEYSSPFELLIAVMLSAQATDISVNRATGDLFRAAPDAAAMVALGEDGVRTHIRHIGLFNTKAKNVIKASRLLLERHEGQVPAVREDLEALPGVGRKTANVVLNTAFGRPTVAVDTHIFRVSNRTRIAPGKNVKEVEDRLLRRLPKEFLHNAHHWLILHGRYICTARRPHCSQCPIHDLCEYPDKTSVQ
ncbi:endonuclease III [Thioalkalivibrio sp. HK1]|uniref:endonuclease III n=1 Tax=Thioalkalivibrio sp. HK1 TaxID=1469245 RepID=UPI00047148A9|nr:endonuclease III [Thioalkalivibrio sp. HK1]